MDGATTLRCAPLTFGSFSDDHRRPLEDHLAMSREVTEWKFALLPHMYPCGTCSTICFSITHQIGMRFHPIDASATPIQKATLFLRYLNTTTLPSEPLPVHYSLPLFHSLLQCPPSPLPMPLRSAMAGPLTRSPTLSMKVGAPF